MREESGSISRCVMYAGFSVHSYMLTNADPVRESTYEVAARASMRKVCRDDQSRRGEDTAIRMMVLINISRMSLAFLTR